MSTSANLPVQRRGYGKVILVAVIAAMGGFLFGFDSAVINGAVDAIKLEFHLSPAALGWTVSCALLGAMLGAWFAGSLSNRIGRTRAMVVAAVMFFAAAFGAGLAGNVAIFVIWRLIGGFGIGMASVLAPAYIAEVSPAKIRGRLGSLQQLAIVIGIFAALLSDAWLAESAGGASKVHWLGLPAWRWMFLVGVVPSVIYGVCALLIPESPRYLVAKGKLVEAARILVDVTGETDTTTADTTISRIQQTLRAEKSQRFADLRGRAAGLKPIVWVGIALSVFQQFVGINVIFYYSTALWSSVGFKPTASFDISVFTSIINIVVTIVAILCVDKIGRKPLLLIGSAGMTVTLAAMAIAFANAHHVGATVELPHPWGVVALIAANLFVVFFGATWGPIVWVLLGEMFPNAIRAVALAIAAAAQWLANFIVTVTFPSLSAIGLQLAYGLYAAFALLSFLFVWKFVHETKGVELEQMTDAA